jgi:hypothetical protein
VKTSLKNTNKYFKPIEVKSIKEFIQFLQKELPLSTNINISFDVERVGNMTTGVRLAKHDIHVLVKDRLLIDILRTLSHEWVHEFQHQKMGIKDNDKIKDIGGPEENMANVLSGIFMKKFVKEFPEFKDTMYGENN